MCCFGHTRFAADVFHDLHEQVIATSARGRKVLTRVQNIEAALPSLEKAVKNQKSHIHFAYVPGNYLFTSSMSKSTLIMRVHPSNWMSLLSILNSLISRLYLAILLTLLIKHRLWLAHSASKWAKSPASEWSASFYDGFLWRMPRSTTALPSR